MNRAEAPRDGWSLTAAELGLLPDAVIRAGIRRLLTQRLREEEAGDVEASQRRHEAIVRAMRTAPIAVETRAANDQHYEVPPAFFTYALGPNLKYSSALFGPDVTDLGAAEEAMLALTTERAGLEDGQDVLELGCGWGSLTLYAARRFPRARITAVSNSRDQRAFIEARAAERGLSNVRVLTADMNDFEAPGIYDRIVSVEMLEHMRNWEALLARVASWLREDGRLFIHIFTHRTNAYFFDAKPGDDTDWMARNFFSGGLMPSDRLLHSFSRDLAVERHWCVSGTHYEKTAARWLGNLDRHRSEVLALFERTYGKPEARRRFGAWRLFFMACEELWGYRGGNEWLVSHYLLSRR
ncbi:MAG: class I SAM-dependent methyltransferase [Acidobacteria bacterium]|nr:class I SAM-dependent methyltransferase [Acidobacteriota bacterium]